MLVKAGIREANRYSSPATVRAEVLSEAFGYADLGDNYNKARELIEKAVEEETEYGLGFKKLAINEQQLAYGGEKYFMPGNVMFRDNRRTLNNKAVSPLSEAWDIGWVGAAEGLYGFRLGRMHSEPSEHERGRHDARPTPDQPESCHCPTVEPQGLEPCGPNRSHRKRAAQGRCSESSSSPGGRRRTGGFSSFSHIGLTAHHRWR